MPEQFKSLPPTPVEQIQKRLENTMRQLKLEMDSQGVDMASVEQTFWVQWAGGQVEVLTPTPMPTLTAAIQDDKPVFGTKPRGRDKVQSQNTSEEDDAQ